MTHAPHVPHDPSEHSPPDPRGAGCLREHHPLRHQFGRRLPEGLELLGGGYVRRTPTKQDLASRRPLGLSERDLDVLVAVHNQGFLTARLIQLAFYPAGPNGRRWASSGAHARLRQLWLWGLLERVERPVPRKLGGSVPFLYAIGRRAVPWVAQRLGAPGTLGGDGGLPVQRRRLDRLNPQFVDHDLHVAGLWANAAALVRDRRGAALRWTGERALRARKLRVRDPRTGKTLPFLPDAYFEVSYGNGGGEPALQCCVVEMDMGSLTIPRFRRKLRAFELALESEPFMREWGRPEFEVLVLTRSERRLRHLQRAARAEVPPGRRSWYSFATVAVLDASRFDGACWLTLEGEPSGLLYDADDADDAAGSPIPHGAGAAALQPPSGGGISAEASTPAGSVRPSGEGGLR